MFRRLDVFDLVTNKTITLGSVCHLSLEECVKAGL